MLIAPNPEVFAHLRAELQHADDVLLNNVRSLYGVGFTTGWSSIAADLFGERAADLAHESAAVRHQIESAIDAAHRLEHLALQGVGL